MLHVVVRCALAAVLVLAASSKLARPRESSAALRGLVSWLPLPVLVAVELGLAAGVALGFDLAAMWAAIFLGVSAGILGHALRTGRAGAPCGCFGARSRVSAAAVARAALLALAFAALPLVPHADLSATTWLAAGLGIALAGVLVLAVSLLALAREIGMLRLAVGPQSALEIPEEGPPLGSDSALSGHLDPRADTSVLGLAVFTSDGCHLCQRLKPALTALGRDPHVSLFELDEVRDAAHWARLDVPGSPYAVALDASGRVLAKGTFNSLPQLESVLAAAERRRAEQLGV